MSRCHFLSHQQLLPEASSFVTEKSRDRWSSGRQQMFKLNTYCVYCGSQTHTPMYVKRLMKGALIGIVVEKDMRIPSRAPTYYDLD
eukprot:g39139.t1